MKHYFRLLYIFLRSLWAPKAHFLEQTSVPFRVWFTDLDLLMHMNNGIYLSLMDLGRVDLTLRSGFYGVLQKHKIYPVLGSEAIRFRRSLALFQAFQIQTQVWNWDEKYFYLRQQFVVKDEIYASALIKARFLRKNGDKVSPQEIFGLLNMDENQARNTLKPDPAQLETYKGVESLLDSSN